MLRSCDRLTANVFVEILLKIFLIAGFILFLLGNVYAREADDYRIERVFRTVDIINDGLVDRGEFDIYHLRIFYGLDLNNDERVAYEECDKGCFKHLNEEGLHSIGVSNYKFQTIDADESGDLSVPEYILYGRDQFDFYDINKDGFINEEEFCSFYRESTPCIYSATRKIKIDKK